ncbi:MAG: RecQ family ATP-dependent DNA helicase [Bacteroidales bacterium]|nr:RecQ family ATP-dependent DNA helicase [Bacteroidales bacterium]
MVAPQEILKKYWGYDSFRPLQEEIIHSILLGHDTLVLLPTGGGKSICYQIPALAMEGLCLVVSPLISLMKDQVQQLTSRHIKAACLVSGTSSIEQEIILNNCIYGKVKMLYVSPERLQQRLFLAHFKQMKVSMIAVDEAHCISQWGYDFRPPYLEIARLRAYHPQAPVMALTATATPVVVQDIMRHLDFRPSHNFFQSSFMRENLSYMVFREADKLGRMLRVINKTGGSGIVYVRNRRRTKEVAEFLSQNGISAAYYHAGLDTKTRDLAQARWMKDDVGVMVATNAFGMGIDKPDVRFVIHLDIPPSIEAYFQEAGRAGRDGKRAYAVLLFDQPDLELLHQLHNSTYPSRQLIANVYRALSNYYQVPIGSGEGCQFDFDLDGICSVYHLGVLDLYNAAKFLECEGLIALPEREESESKLYINIDRDALYRFQLDQPRYSDLVAILLRLYGGVFSEFVPISERLIASRLMVSEEQVRKFLLHLDALKVIVYMPKKLKPQIIFTSPRINEKDLYLSDQNYKNLERCAYDRMASMERYVLAEEGCRSQLLLSYFGEEDSASCRCCDLCITEHNKGKEQPNLRRMILDLLASAPMSGDQLLQYLPQLDERDVRAVLRQLVDERVVAINELLEFSI